MCKISSTHPRGESGRPSRNLAAPDSASASESRKYRKTVKAMAAAGGVSSDDVPILQTENLTNNVKSIYYRYLSLSSARSLPMRSIRSGALSLLLGLIWT